MEPTFWDYVFGYVFLLSGILAWPLIFIWLIASSGPSKYFRITKNGDYFYVECKAFKFDMWESMENGIGLPRTFSSPFDAQVALKEFLSKRDKKNQLWKEYLDGVR